jgi:hypothetical protein
MVSDGTRFGRTAVCGEGAERREGEATVEAQDARVFLRLAEELRKVAEDWHRRDVEPWNRRDPRSEELEDVGVLLDKADDARRQGLVDGSQAH